MKSRILTPTFLRRALALLPCAFLAGCMGAGFRPLPAGVERENVIFSPPSWPQRLPATVYHHPRQPPAPAVLVIHGGSWKADDVRWSMEPISKALARAGYVVVNATYRGTPDDPYPAAVRDLEMAVRWMRRHAGRYGIDPERIATLGYSAGGHLAALLALREGNPEWIRAIVAGGAPFDLELDPNDEAVTAFLGGTHDEVPARFHQASPVNFVGPTSPPLFIFHGTADHRVAPAQARRMAAAYRGDGRPFRTYWVEGRGHLATLAFPGGAIDEAIRFLNEQLMPGKQESP
ncbi:alpha/beta hydrolase [Haloferula sargassicola]|uniref:BD-FAE-like domain-containing protein n=1 Tax=Haloferula sargassicola TaxID=490096 RepID=A0ABP9URX6_9BACT